MKSSFKVIISLLAILFVFPQPASAHLIGGNGIVSGLTHPLFGLDHLLAMVAVGIISVQIGGRAIWQVPTTFVLFMIVGGIFGISGMAMPFTETGIALSVLLLGAAIALSRRIALNLAIISVALFAVFHGHAHGEEMPTIGHPALYALGFVLSTTALHITGVLIGHHAKRTKLSLKLLKYSGIAVSLFGIYFLLGV